ncbi:hypothetical protein FQN58_04175 [Bacteroides xylanisolvens]|nr:hypothetical protein FQN58_04175 [Bacteroides xylanisolvens]
MCPFSDSRQIYKNQFDKKEKEEKKKDSFAKKSQYNTPRFSDRHNYGGMTRNRYICKKEENQNGKTI